jgi:cytochrome c-type biogenesis protein CcmI
VVFAVAAILIVAGVALFVAAPLSGGLAGRKPRTREQLQLDHWQHEHSLAVQGLRELEFDREMGKLTDQDYASLRAGLEARALEAMTAIEKIKDQERAANLAAIATRSKPARPAPPVEPPAPVTSVVAAPLPVTPPAAPIAAPAPARAADVIAGRRVRFCPNCGMRAPASGNFCGECGTALRGERVATRAS